VPLGSLFRLPAAAVAVAAGVLDAEVIGVDGFGNVQLAATAADLAAADLTAGRVVVHIGSASWQAALGETFGAVAPGELVVLVDSAGHVALAVNGGAAAAALGVTDGDTVRLAGAPGGTSGGAG